MFTAPLVALGVAKCVIGGWLAPDYTIGVGGDHSLGHVAALTLWWTVVSVSAGITGARVVAIATAAMQTRQALRIYQAKEQALILDAERLRLCAAEERANALRSLAGTFDGEVRSLVAAVSQTSAGIGVQATAVSAAADTTNVRVRRAASLSEAVAADTSVVAQNTTSLGQSLAEVRGHAASVGRSAEAAALDVERSSAAVMALVEATGRVAEAVSLISAIAGQTNLLGLNATIEAARAGDAGRGFAVVAAEVKQLARRTSGTANGVNALVQDMQRAGENATESLTGISRRIAEVGACADHVNTAVTEQASSVAAISRTIASLSGKSGEVRAQVFDVAAAADATSQAAGMMQGAADTLQQNAGSLQRQAGIFIQNVYAA